MERKKMNLKKGDIIELTIDDLAYGGERVGHYKGIAVFIDKGVVGEKVKVKIYKRKKSFLKAKLLKVIDSSTNRIDPPCDIYEDCGGCQLQEIDYEYQLKLKNKIINTQLSKIGKLKNLDSNKVIDMDYPWNYRNKAQFPFKKDEEGKIVVGFYKRGSHDIVSLKRCPIQHQLINRITRKTLEILNEYDNFSVYNEKSHQGFLRHLVVRVGVCTNQAMLAFVTNGPESSHLKEIAEELMQEIPELISVMQNINRGKTNVIMGEKTKLLKGQKRYRDYIGNKKFDISLESFFQTNTIQTKKLYDTALDFADLSGNETLFDCYCGTGSIGLYFSDKVKKVVGIDINKNAIKDARHNKELNSIENAEFIVGDVRQNIKNMFNNYADDNTVMLFDPPRKGLTEDIINTILEKKAKKIIYISCNPATLARDLKKLKHAYNIKKIRGIDMFPQTYHIETVSLLERK